VSIRRDSEPNPSAPTSRASEDRQLPVPDTQWTEAPASDVMASNDNRPRPLLFWIKINNDWIFNLAGVLAYNFLLATVPILVLLLAAAGYALGFGSPSTQSLIQRAIANVLPQPIGPQLVGTVADHLRTSARWLLIVGIATSLVTGSRLFITLEGCFGIIFRLRGRHPVPQNVMALGMLAVYIVLAPLLIFASIAPSALVDALYPHPHTLWSQAAIQIGGILVALLAAFLLFMLTYVVVPNRQRERWRIWRGTLVATALLVAYEWVFPLYNRFLFHPGNYGSVAGFAVVILIFFYYLGFIVLLGAEINSWDAGQRETASDLPGILHAVQAHRSTRRAAGPTAGQPQEEMQRHRRSRWPWSRH
jgi:membrane protein